LTDRWIELIRVDCFLAMSDEDYDDRFALEPEALSELEQEQRQIHVGRVQANKWSWGNDGVRDTLLFELALANQLHMRPKGSRKPNSVGPGRDAIFAVICVQVKESDLAVMNSKGELIGPGVDGLKTRWDQQHAVAEHRYKNVPSTGQVGGDLDALNVAMRAYIIAERIFLDELAAEEKSSKEQIQHLESQRKMQADEALQSFKKKSPVQRFFCIVVEFTVNISANFCTVVEFTVDLADVAACIESFLTSKQ
jgi:hypothetical protein